MRFFTNISQVTAAYIVAGFFAFLYTVLVARMLLLPDYGLFQALMGIYGIIAGFGVPFTLSAIHCVGGAQESQKKWVAGEFLKLSLLVGSAFCGVQILAAFALIHAFGAASLAPFFALALLLFAVTVLITLHGIVQGYGRFGLFAGARVLQSIFTLILGVSLLSFGTGVSGAILAYFLSMTLVSLILIFKFDLYSFHKGYALIREELRSVVKIIGIFFVIFTIDSAPMILSRISLSEVECGLYGSLYNLRNIILPFGVAAAMVYYSHAISNRERRRLGTKTMGYVLVLGGAFSLAGLLCPEWIIGTIYGDRYLGASGYLALYGLSLTLLMALIVYLLHEMESKKLRRIPLLMPLLALAVCFIFFHGSIRGLILSQIIACTSYFITCLIARRLRIRQLKG